MQAVDGASTGRTATRDEGLSGRRRLRELAAAEGLRGVRVDASGTVLVASDQPGYAAVRRFATAATEALGTGWVRVVADDSEYARRATAEPL
jgi:hypothetical protein